MNELQIKEEINIENMIYEIRGKQVMLDRDLAKLYNTNTRTLIQRVKRNIERFPENFCFQLTFSEFKFWKSQIVMSKNDQIGLRRAPYVFTEQGVAMLSAIIKSDIAVVTSIQIMNAFVNMKNYISTSFLDQKYINELVLKDNKRINLLESTFSKFRETKSEIYFEGQIYDAYSKIIDIVDKAKKELIIIDSYADKSVLDIISKIKCNVILICKTKGLLNQIDIDKYNKQYHNLKIIYNNSFHDRYFILDKKILYHCGTSLNHIGEKTFSINKIDDTLILSKLIEEIKNLCNYDFYN